MIVKKFQALTETEAVIKAQEELGSGAVVLNVKTLKQRGIFRLFKKDIVEITAALEEKDFVQNISQNKPRFQNNIGINSHSINIVADEKLDAGTKSEMLEVKLDSLHNSLRNQLEKETDFEKAINEVTYSKQEEKKVVREKENNNFKFLQLIYQKLIDNDVDEKFANMIISEIEGSLKKESNIDSLLAGVYQKIILKLGEPKPIVLGKKTKVAFFIGPTGVGKTTTIAKIASTFKLEHQTKVAFITADTYRIAAVEQLNTYASIIDCPVDVVYSADEIVDCLKLYESYDLILVDTAGRTHKNEEQMTEIIDLLQKAANTKDLYDIEVFLTLSITTKYKDLVKITEAYKDVQEYKIIFTKLDETCCLGNILNLKLLTNAPLSYTTSGQNVPTDIEVINEQSLAKQLLGGND
ncbi:flagellar biosynthesis protein FlhF [[Clostridium] fimetarium]|uniref:Flagellar biosynthesis protein FlhF n=1 Tax=[Clostridium] fimetarium TaxID=99656 RepID=A0A1I0N1V0_9FIRM|nr:flagellar biosynthesis protein FlhF [[Clostridium] fimetarium]SEV95024.1 flagellar biosynthesis protein FlhF [[Clostridium] fimetarium]